MTKMRAIAIAILAISFSYGASGQTRPGGGWKWELPATLPPPRTPPDNPMSEDKFQLGRKLFYDARLSGNGTTACATCHLQERAFTDGKATSTGSLGESTPRNSPGIANAAWRATLTWANPALVTLERQAEVPLFGENPVEMGVNDANRREVLLRFRSDSTYPAEFARAFPGEAQPVTYGNIIKAIAVFERGVVSASSKFDLYLEGRAQLTPEEMRGKDLFFGEKAECHHCHGGPHFDDQFYHARTREASTPFHNTGLYNLAGGDYPDPGRGAYDITQNPEDMGAFRAPSLRNVAVTAPYMHDGSVATLEEAIDIYAAGGRNIVTGPLAGDGRTNPHKSPLITPLDLSREDKADLVAFLKTLTDDALLHSSRYGAPLPARAAP